MSEEISSEQMIFFSNSRVLRSCTCSSNPVKMSRTSVSLKCSHRDAPESFDPPDVKLAMDGDMSISLAFDMRLNPEGSFLRDSKIFS